jgi:DNA repair protein RecO (recombination protein O)
MASFSVEAVVLTRRDMGEADRLLTIFSRTLGKQRVLAKGVRRPTSRMGAHIEPGRIALLYLVERRSLPLVTQASTQELFLSPAADLREFQDLFQLLQIVERLTEDGQRDSRLYDLVVSALRHIRQAHAQSADTTSRPAIESHPAIEPQAVVHAFALQALRLLGYQIELNDCLTCEKPVSSSDTYIYLSAPRGGVMHTDCATPGPGNFRIAGSTLHIARSLVTAKLATIKALHTAAELHRPLASFLEWTSERKLTTFNATLPT